MYWDVCACLHNTGSSEKKTTSHDQDKEKLSSPPGIKDLHVCMCIYTYTRLYYMSNSRECMGSMGKPCSWMHAVYKKPYFLLQVMRESASVLQVTWESISGTASHTCCIRTCKVRMIKSLSPKYQAILEKYHLFVAIGIVTHAAHS